MTDLRGAHPLLEVEGLRISIAARPEVALVEGVSFRLERGESLGIVGETGSGKSLTALAVIGLLPPTLRVDGSVRLNGEELIGRPEAELRALRGSQIGMVFQDPNESLNPVFTIGKQLEFAIRAHSRLDRRAVRARALELLDMVSVPRPLERIRQFPHELSGGLRQRVMIAIALASTPTLLIADEPTTALDVSVQAEILELLESLARENGLSTLLITHDLGVVVGQCSRILTMYSGQVVESGSTHGFRTDPAHPYSRALLDCIPTLSQLGTIRPGIPGVPTPPDKYDAGCRFRQRCPLAEARCAEPQTLGPVASADAGPRLARCWKAAGPDLVLEATSTGASS